VVLDLSDRPALASRLRAADAAVHTASPGDATSAELDTAVVDAVIDALGGTGKVYAHISGLWIYGNNLAIDEQSKFDPPAMVAWKPPIEHRVLTAADMRGVVIVSGSAYGDGGGGAAGLLLGSPRDDAGNLVMIGSGNQHWTTVHVTDLAALFRHVLESPSASGRYICTDGSSPTVAELTQATAVAVGAKGASPGSDAEARARVGDLVAGVLLLDQHSIATRATDELGWHPTQPSLADELEHGSYRR
jgi:nucleoside-diphosphate-sugar epimerase